jgi:hypothetical protein
VATDEDRPDDRNSGLQITVSIGIGYSRRRPNTLGDRWEARLDSIGLLIVGSVIAVAVVVVLLPRILNWLGTLGGGS